MDNLNNLIPELENIVGDYTDETDYKKLIQLDSKIHTHDKLLLKQLSDVPTDLLLQYREMYNLALQFNKTVEQTYYLSPEYLTNMLMRFKGFYPKLHTLKDLTKFENPIYYSNTDLRDIKTLQQLIFRDSEILYINIIEDSEYSSIDTFIESHKNELIQMFRKSSDFVDLDTNILFGIIEDTISETIPETVEKFFSNPNKFVDKEFEYLIEFRKELYLDLIEYTNTFP